MPLVRYEIRNEHSLANPQLYRTAGTDDPEGLLEGVAMAGLVGIVRQLGDLAEFAAEVFRDLHEEVMATASRGHELLVRVQQLEAEMPAVEKALLSETNQLRFAYTPGVEWHASIRNDQNHCTQGDLPRFIRNSYEECRGPPRLFLLDKFDVAGAGACLKRYTDPSFFRTEWASSELMKAERVQRDKRARREKKKGRRRRNVDAKDSRSMDPFQSRFSHELSRDLADHDPRSRTWHHSVSERSDEAFDQDNSSYNENVSAISRHLAEAQALGRDMKSRNASQGFAEEAFTKDYADTNEPVLSKVSQSTDSVKQKISAPNVYFKDIKSEENGFSTAYMDEKPVESKRDAAHDVDDVASEGEQFLDALTTMESEEADTDSEPGFKPDKEMNGDRTSVERVYDTNEVESTLRENLNSPRDAPAAENEFKAFDESAPRSTERLTADEDFQRPVTKNEIPLVQTSQILEEDVSVLPPAQTPSEEEVLLPELGSPAKLREDTPRHHGPGVHWNGSVKQYSPKSQDHPISPRFDRVSADGFSKVVSSPRTFKVPDIAGPDFTEDLNVQPSKQDVNRSLNSTTSVHLRKRSTDSVFSSSSRKVYPGESMEGHRESLQAVPKVSMFKSDFRSTSMRSEYDDHAPSPLGAAVKVSKMVAAFETGSLDQIQGIDRNEEPRANGRESSLLKGAMASVKTGNGSFHDAPKTEGTSVQDSYSPVVESPASGTSNSTNDSSARSLPHPPKLRVEVSPSSRVSVGSVDSSPHSPIFSALHSPMSPIRTSRNILSSPDSPGLGFSSQLLLSPTSPTSVPVLDNSPTSKKNPPTIFSRNYDNEFQVVSPSAMDEPFSSVSSPLPAELLPNQSRHHAAFMSPAHLNMLHNGPTSSTMPPDEWNSHFSPSSLASPDDFRAASPDLVPSQRRWPVDNSEEHGSTVISTVDVADTAVVEEELHSSPGTPQEEQHSSPGTPQEEQHSSPGTPQEEQHSSPGTPQEEQHSSPGTSEEELQSSPGTPQGVDHSRDNAESAQISPRSHVDEYDHDTRGSPDPDALLNTEPLLHSGMTTEIPIIKVETPEVVPTNEEVVRADPDVSATSPLSSASHHSLTPTFSEGRRDDALLPRKIESENAGTAEQLQLETSRKSGALMATHKRFPSLPPSETTSQDLSWPFTKASILSRTARVGPGPGSKFVNELPFRSPPSRTIYDLPFPVPKGAHKRHPSFPSSEKTTLDLAAIASSRRLQDTVKEFAIPVKPVSDVGIQPSKRAHGPPSSSRSPEELHPLPSSSPPSTSEREVVSPPPLPFRTLHELPPPPPPSRSPPPLTGSKSATGADTLLGAIISHDKTTLKKVKTMQNPSLRKGDDRAHMLEQIRAQSFNLRHTAVEKYEPPLPRPVTNINVAAILEKANAIRQAFAGSDEDDEDDDDWSDV